MIPNHISIKKVLAKHNFLLFFCVGVKACMSGPNNNLLYQHIQNCLYQYLMAEWNYIPTPQILNKWIKLSKAKKIRFANL